MYWSGSLGWTVGLGGVHGWAVIAVFSTWSNTRVRELEIRERIAMIEKGLVPPPEVDPAGFDRAMHRHERPGFGGPGPALRRAGIMILSIGFGLMFLIAVAGGSVRAGIGVGGFLVMIGLAFLVNSLFEPHGRNTSVPPGPPVPPAN